MFFYGNELITLRHRFSRIIFKYSNEVDLLLVTHKSHSHVQILKFFRFQGLSPPGVVKSMPRGQNTQTL